MKEQHKTSLQQWLIEIISQPMSGLSADIVSINMGEWVKTSDSFNFCFLCLGGRLVYEHLSKDANLTPKLKVTKEEIGQLFPSSLMKLESLAGWLITGEKDVDTLPLFFTQSIRDIFHIKLFVIDSCLHHHGRWSEMKGPYCRKCNQAEDQ